MVIPDWNASPRPPKLKLSLEHSGPVRFARPLDRLAAAIIDVCILLTPIYLLLSSPLKRALTTSFILNSEPDLYLTGVSLVLLAVIVIMVYQTIAHFYFGATAGKRILGLRVIPMFGTEPLSLWDSFLRSAVWVIEVLCLGLPFLAVFSNVRRRPMHDRVSDTVVVTHTAFGVSAPTILEQGLVRGVFTASLAALAFFGFIEVRGTFERMRIESAFLSVDEKDVGECDVVSQNIENKDSSEHGRLDLAMSLYAAGLADRSCLESEVEREVAMQLPIGPVTYLAQAFVYADDAEVSNSYLDKVCEDAPDSVECYMSQLVTSWSDEDWPAVEQILRTAPQGSGYLEVWGVRHYMKQAQYENALHMLDILGLRRELASFSMVQRTKALFNTYRTEESQVALQQALVALPRDESQDVSSWMCAQQLQNGCAALQSVACGQIPKGDEINFANSAEALAQVFRLECKAEGKADYIALSESVKDSSWQVFFRANLKRQREDRSASAALFAQVIQDEDSPDLLRIEAARRWLTFATPRQLETAVDLWRGLESKEAWVKTGNLLFSRLTESQNSDLALKVARHLMNWQALSPKGMTQLSAMVENAPQARRPASEKVREQVKQLLDGLEEN